MLEKQIAEDENPTEPEEVEGGGDAITKKGRKPLFLFSL